MIYDTTIDLLKLLFNGLEFLKPYATIGGVIFLILRQNGIKKIINGHLPRRFRDTHDSDIQEIKQDIKDIKSHLGVASSNLQQNGLRTTEIQLYKKFYLFLQAIRQPQKRRMNMKAYLAKLGKTKFQAFLIITFTNIIMLIGSVTGFVDIDGKINEWMPAINLVVQLIATLVYTSVEGSIDKANIQASSPNPSVTVSTSPSGSSVTLTGGQTDAIPTIDTDSNK